MTPITKEYLDAQPIARRAMRIARLAHDGQTRRDRVTPYYTHVSRVATRVYNYGMRRFTTAEQLTHSVATAFLHDVVEDTKWNFFHLSELGRMPPEVIEAVKVLTRFKDEDYFKQYLPAVLKNPLARIVKFHDILDNLSETPSPAQIEKYGRALTMLGKVLD